MSRSTRIGGCLLALIASTPTAACEDSTGPETATVIVRLAVSGTDVLPLDFYVALGDQPARAIRANTTILITDVIPGMHTLELRGVPEHCTADGNPRSLGLARGQRVQVTFAVACATESPPCYYNFYYCWAHSRTARAAIRKRG